jgi:hypothetical protein
VFAGRPNLAARHLLATTRGLAARPCNELVEMVDHERALGRPASRAAQLHEITGDPMWQPTFVFYMGYPPLLAHASPAVQFKPCSSDKRRAIDGSSAIIRVPD